MGIYQKSNQSTRRKFRPKPKWRNPGKAWEPRTRRQEKKYRVPRALSRVNEWRYSQKRTEVREKQVKKSVKTLLRSNRFINRVWRWIQKKVFGVEPFSPERIDPNHYVTEVNSEQRNQSHESAL